MIHLSVYVFHLLHLFLSLYFHLKLLMYIENMPSLPFDHALRIPAALPLPGINNVRVKSLGLELTIGRFMWVKQ